MFSSSRCSLTGHRPKSFPWGYNESARDCVLLKGVLTQQIRALEERGVTDFLSGMALGVDLWCAEIVLDLRVENPAIRLHCVLPCEGQDAKWPDPEKKRYHSILEQADEVVYVHRSYNDKCMLERNHYLVDHAAVVLAVYNGNRHSGTGATVSYARKMGREIIVIDPITHCVTT